MNVFRKISGAGIFATEKKKPKQKVPQSAEKLAAKQQECYFLIDYEIRGDGLLMCRLTKDGSMMKKIGWRKIGTDIKQCTVKNPSYDLWIGKQYWFVDMSPLRFNDDDEIHQNNQCEKYAAERMVLVNEMREVRKWSKR